MLGRMPSEVAMVGMAFAQADFSVQFTPEVRCTSQLHRRHCDAQQPAVIDTPQLWRYRRLDAEADLDAVARHRFSRNVDRSPSGPFGRVRVAEVPAISFPIVDLNANDCTA